MPRSTPRFWYSNIARHARSQSPLGLKRYVAHFHHHELARSPAPLKLPPGFTSLLPLILSSNNLVLPGDPSWPANERYSTGTVGSRTEDRAVTLTETVVPFFLSHNHASDGGQRLGYLRPAVVRALSEDHEELAARSPWDMQLSDAGNVASVSFTSRVNGEGQSSRTQHMERIVKGWKDRKMFADILGGSGGEAYPIFRHPPSEEDVDSGVEPVAFSLERTALPLFGFPNFGCLLTAYFHCPETGKMMLWIPRRSMHKRTWPGCLDVTVGGGIGLGDSALSTIVRESAEEASLDAKYVRTYVRSVGVLPYPNRSPAGWILPGMYYLYDLPLPSDGSIRPRINAADGEVESFEVMDAQNVLHNLLEGKFKASSALALVDFLIRHGFVTKDTDRRFEHVCMRLRGYFGLAVPWR